MARTGDVVSLNEWVIVLRKAAFARGVERECATELAEGLALVGGAAMLSALLEALDAFEPAAPAQWLDEGEMWSAPFAAVLRDGPAMIDLAELAGSSFARVDDVSLLNALVAQRAVAAGHIIRLHATGSFVRLTVTDEPVGKPCHTTCAPDDAEFAQLKRMTDALLVPADETSRADAGAGNTDND